MERFVLKGKLLIDGTGRPPIENGVVLIEGNRIAAAGGEKDVIPPTNVKVIDCGAQVLIPGLIDCHNHLAMDPTLDNWPARLNDSDAEQAIRATVHMGIDLKTGVTMDDIRNLKRVETVISRGKLLYSGVNE
ncbi:MAG: hypothetical protein QME78_17060 [Thermodesulfobacteriota bacterium]|nr:hypothetical protein [Thermodesulfobacteriota bacterium]